MSPEEKAKELIRKFYSIGAIECKQCALIAVELALESTYFHAEFLNEVKKEIEKL